MYEMSKGRKALLLATLISTTIAMMGDCTVTPAADTLYKQFNNEAGVNLFLAIPTLVAMGASVLFGALCAKLNKKVILLIGAACFTVGGLCGGLVDSLGYMIFMRCFIGIGLGACNVAAISICAQVFSNEEDRRKSTSYVMSGLSLSGVILTFVGGLLAENFGWKSTFQVSWFGIVMIALIIFFVPSCPPIKERLDDSGARRVPREESRRRWPARMILSAFGQLCFLVVYGICYFQIAVYVAERGIGTEAFSGVVAAASNIAGFAGNLLFVLIYKKIKRGAGILHFAALAIGYSILLIFGTQATTIIGVIFIGFSFGNAGSYFASRATVVVPESKYQLSVTIFSATQGFGMFISTYVAMAIKSLLKADTFIGMLPVDIAIAAIAAIIVIILVVRERKHPSDYYLPDNAPASAGGAV